MTYQPKTYRDKGGDRIVVANGGQILIETGGALVAPNPSGAQDYFVDGNVSASGTGLTWATAFKTLSEAILASNTSIALSDNRWWARRNRIFACGDMELDEDLTVLPEKCDVIGVGTDLWPYPRFIGNHTIAAATPGVRFINMGFVDEAGDSDVFTIPAGCHGLSFIGCHFWPKGDAGNTSKGLTITDCVGVRIVDCQFDLQNGNATHIFATAINMAGSTFMYDLLIENCHITATIGIAIADGNLLGSLIRNNVIRATGLTIDDNSDECQIIDNRLISDGASDTSAACATFDFNLLLAVGNRITASDDYNACLPVEGVLD